MKTTIKVASPDEFFQRGKKIAKLADQGKRIPRERVISFEDPEDLARLITTAKLVLFREVKECPGSITDLGPRLPGDGSGVKRGCCGFERFGLGEKKKIPFPGDGPKKK